jgi:Fic family protein
MDVGNIGEDKVIAILTKKEVAVSDKENMVIAFRQALSIIEKNYSQIKIAPNYLKGLHQRILRDRQSELNTRGKYKSSANMFISLDDAGNKTILADTAAPELVESRIAELIEMINLHCLTKKYHPLILTALFYYEIISIHPFQSANSVFAKLMLNLLLLQNGYNFVMFTAFEASFLSKKEDYYSALLSGLKMRGERSENIGQWLLFMLDCIIAEIDMLAAAKKEYDKKGVYLNKRQKRVIDFIQSNQPIKLADLSDKFKKISINTLKKDLAYLKNENVVASQGKNKGTVYYISKD